MMLCHCLHLWPTAPDDSPRAGAHRHRAPRRRARACACAHRLRQAARAGRSPHARSRATSKRLIRACCRAWSRDCTASRRRISISSASAAATGARLIHAEANGIDRLNKRVELAGRPPIAYDLLSVDVGITPALGAIEGAAEHAIAVKPIGSFLSKFNALLEDCRRSGRAAPDRGDRRWRGRRGASPFGAIKVAERDGGRRLLLRAGDGRRSPGPTQCACARRLPPRVRGTRHRIARAPQGARRDRGGYHARRRHNDRGGRRADHHRCRAAAMVRTNRPCARRRWLPRGRARPCRC